MVRSTVLLLSLYHVLQGTMKNFFTFTGVEDYDPEGSGSIYYPITKELVFGVNIAF